MGIAPNTFFVADGFQSAKIECERDGAVYLQHISYGELNVKTALQSLVEIFG